MVRSELYIGMMTEIVVMKYNMFFGPVFCPEETVGIGLQFYYRFRILW